MARGEPIEPKRQLSVLAPVGTRDAAGPARVVYAVLADAFSVYRLGVRALIEEQADLAVSEAGNLAELEERLDSRPTPNIALVDLDLPPTGARDAVRLLRRRDVAAIVWSSRGRLSSELILDVVRAGAVGVLSKEISPAGLIRALRGVTSGEAPLSRDLACALIEGLHSTGPGEKSRSRVGTLSRRERQVLALVSEGCSNREIASALAVSEFTAKRHVQNILCKLSVHSRLAASASYRALRELSSEPIHAAVTDDPV
jgi:DNA-binding NarL/FixJ family response regulator